MVDVTLRKQASRFRTRSEPASTLVLPRQRLFMIDCTGRTGRSTMAHVYASCARPNVRGQNVRVHKPLNGVGENRACAGVEMNAVDVQLPHVHSRTTSKLNGRIISLDRPPELVHGKRESFQWCGGQLSGLIVTGYSAPTMSRL